LKITGTHTLGARRADVFAAICDPDALLAVIPGCRDIEQVGHAEYRGRISLRLPGVVGTYRTVVRLVDSDPPARGDLEGELEGSLGSIRGRATFRLTDAGEGTRIDYEGEAVIGGPLARFDSRFVEGLAGSLIDQGLRNMDSRLSGGRLVAPESQDDPTTREIRA
jgi:carbon monoxide dehydrogenase subunit G